MRGRPKLVDSRRHQYRVRLNDVESQKLEYASSRTGKPKSEIFRLALIDYYNKVLLCETNDLMANEEYWDLGGVSLKRVIRCPHCKSQMIIDLEDECSVTAYERQMGAETLYEFDFDMLCPMCNDPFRVRGYISEYPDGALDSEQIDTHQVECQ